MNHGGVVTINSNSTSVMSGSIGAIRIASAVQSVTTDGDLLGAIEAIGAESARTAKEAALARLAMLPYGQKVISLAYNPFLTYGVTCKGLPKFRGPDVSSAASLPLIEDLLMRMASRELSGNDARFALDDHFHTLPKAAAKILWLCLNKDLKVGINTASIKAVSPDLIPIFAVMRAHPYEEKRITEFPVAVEPKLDGYRVTFIAKDGSGGFFTRTGKVIADLDYMVEPTLKALRYWANMARITNGQPNAVEKFRSELKYISGTPEVVLDGEMMPDSGQFNDVKAAMKEQRAIYNIFDMLSWQEFDAMGAVEVSYLERRCRALDFAVAAKCQTDKLAITPVEFARSHDEILEIYEKHRAAGQEGAMVKKLSGLYHKKKTHDWLKVKAQDTEDLPIIGVFQGQAGGKYENTIGGLIVDRNGVAVRVSGLDDATRAEIWELWCQDIQALGGNPAVGYDGWTHGENGLPENPVLLSRLIEVEFHEVTPDGSLRHPRFIQFRDDKAGEVEK